MIKQISNLTRKNLEKDSVFTSCLTSFATVLMSLLPSSKMELMERDALGVVGQAGFAQNKEQ